METEGSLPCSKEPAIGPYPEPYESSPSAILFLKDLTLSFHLRLGIPSGLFSPGFSTETLNAFLLYYYYYYYYQ
jgi:hypothetical protein